MFTAIIVLLYVFVMYMCIANEEWLALGISTIVMLLLVEMAHIDHEDAKAYINFRDYWAKGGPRGRESGTEISVNVRQEVMICPTCGCGSMSGHGYVLNGRMLREYECHRCGTTVRCRG